MCLGCQMHQGRSFIRGDPQPGLLKSRGSSRLVAIGHGLCRPSLGTGKCDGCIMNIDDWLIMMVNHG